MTEYILIKNQPRCTKLLETPIIVKSLI